ncbi:phase cyclin A-associated in the endoplasmic reticulum-like isoform X1 [Octopus vulgaris]|nr:phase cyclin A-associated in the endoplasmic reticulum-like isoform X1 [Octopus vulgaris]
MAALNQNNGRTPFTRMSGLDRVRRIVQEEGRTARNLVQYNLPLQERPISERSSRAVTRQWRMSSKLRSVSVSAKDKMMCGSGISTLKCFQDLTKSPKSDSSNKRADVRARYWAFLFDNLQRAVDAIYETCEQDESVVECKEVIMMLEQSTKDFNCLIKRLQLLRDFDNAAKDGDRPISIAWEVRKMSPGKTTSHSPIQDCCSPTSAQRVLNFGTSNATIQPLESPVKSPLGNSWADRVKGITSGHSPAVNNSVTSSVAPNDELNQENDDEADGWETVQRGGKSKSRNHNNNNNSNVVNNNNNSSRSEKSYHNNNNNSNNNVAGFAKNRRSEKYSNNRTFVESNNNNNNNHSCSNSHNNNNNNNNSNFSKSTVYLPGQKDRVFSSSPTSIHSNYILPCVSDQKLHTNCPKSPQPHNNNNNKNNSNHTRAHHGNHMTPLSSSSSSVKHSVRSPPTPSGAVEYGGRASRTQRREHTPDRFYGNRTWDSGIGLHERTHSKESEKENIPVLGCDLDANDGDDEAEDELLLDIYELEDYNSLKDEESDHVVFSETEELHSMSSQKSPEISDDDKVNFDEDEKKAFAELTSALDEADKLSSQLELANQQEQNWLEKLAQEESTPIADVETENEIENTDLNLEALVNSCEDSESYKSKSWGEIVDEADARTPGHGVHMHEKLSSPSRKRSPTERKKRHEQKQAKAQELRTKLNREKAARLKEISRKVEEVRAWKDDLLRQKKATMERKLLQAEEKRQMQLKMKAQKAHDEEAKANEIAFINSLEAQNKRHDILSKHQESEARLQDMQEERQRKHEEKLAKEAAVEERRKALEADRKKRLHEMQEKRKQRDARVIQQLQEKEKERLEVLRAKEREREERLAALNAQQQAQIQELQKKIQQKQDESTQRHQEILQQIREKAFEMSVLRHSTEDHNEAPQLTPYDQKKLCKVCNVLILSEVHLLSHLRGKKHKETMLQTMSKELVSKQDIETFNLKHIIDAPDASTHPVIASERERQKALKKRCKKLRQRMMLRGVEYENSLSGKTQIAESEHKAKLQKSIKDVNKYLQNCDNGPWPQNRVSALDRALNEVSRIFDKKLPNDDQFSFRILGGLTTLSRLLILMDGPSNATSVIPLKSLVLSCSVFRQVCKGCYDNCHYMLFSNKIGILVDLLIHQLTNLLPDNHSSGDKHNSGPNTKLPSDSLSISLMQLISSILSCLAKNNPLSNSSEASVERMSSSGDAFLNRGNDLISYVISVGIMDKLTHYFSLVQGPIDSNKSISDFLQHSLGLLISLTKFITKRNSNVFGSKKTDDPTQLLATFQVTELVGIVSLLYGMLLHSGVQGRGDVPPAVLPAPTLAVTTAGLRMLNHVATLDLQVFQQSLGEEGMSLEFRHIASYLVWYSSHHLCEELLHEVILCIGNFTVLNSDNQNIVQSGQSPTILQQLCSLPFQYFSDPRLTNILFPTLIAVCYNNPSNKEILEQELSCVLLANFIEEKQLECQQARLMPSKVSKTQDKDKARTSDLEVRMSFASRFPVDVWPAAMACFKQE